MLVNIVSGQDDLGAYGDTEGDQAHRYARTREFMQLVRRLWTEEDVTYDGEHFQVSHSTVATRPVVRGDRRHPRLYFGGASEAAERVAATEADVQLFWGEPLEGVRERIERLTRLTQELGREHAPLEFGLRITTFVRDTTEQAWADAEAKVAEMAGRQDTLQRSNPGFKAVGQQRLLDLAARGEVLDDNLYTTPGKFGGGGAGTTWLVGSADDVASSLRKYQELGHHPLRALRHPVPAGDPPPGRPAPPPPAPSDCLSADSACRGIGAQVERVATRSAKRLEGGPDRALGHGAEPRLGLLRRGPRRRRGPRPSPGAPGAAPAPRRGGRRR